MTTAAQTSPTATAVPAEPLGRLFLRFLHFGLLAWGGPVAQIAMLRQTFVEEERWVSSEHFNRILAMYQILPGPEAQSARARPVMDKAGAGDVYPAGRIG